MAARWPELALCAFAVLVGGAACKTEERPRAAAAESVRLTPRVSSAALPASTAAQLGASDREAGFVAGKRPTRASGTAIVVAGERFDIGAPVVLWSDPGGYDAYRETPFFARDDGATAPSTSGKKRYRPGRGLWSDPASRENEPAPGEPEPTLERLRELVDQFVLHYDVCGTSRRCFEILHDKRNLSVHFLLDLDGTLYQTLDLQETAWHARQANPRSIGIEIANMGAYPPDDDEVLARTYVEDERGVRVALDANAKLATPGFVARPIRPERVRGLANGSELEMHDLTSEQYATLACLTAGLAEIFPRIELDAPRDLAGRVRDDALSDEEFAAWHGLIGHLHITDQKQDPGPAFDWEQLLARARALRALGVGPVSAPRE
ncbi:MAG: N-acetylmuramoyl-L-alanine amidase [Planctomycetes bacterium]|nr:N-acetylmuramoyl-L-alanine amidase [Planctomycetota bacterium]